MHYGTSMRIGIDARMYSSSFTGIGRYVYELTRRLFELDQVNEYVLFLNEPQFSAFTPPYARVRKVLVNAPHYSWAEQVRFARLLRRERLDLMHFTHFNAPLLYRGVSVVTIHDLTLSFFPGKKMTSWWRRQAYHAVLGSVVRRSRRVVAVSENTQRDLVRLFNVPSAKVEVIYEGVGEEFTEGPSGGVRDRYGILDDFFLYTGVWRSHKNVTGLLAAFARLCALPSFTGQLVLTGKEDPFYPEVKSAIRELRLDSRVILAGLVPEEDLVALYREARVFVMPSFYEGFGLPPLEAMACGTPVVCSNTSSLPEVCGGAALFFNPYSVDDMTGAMRRLWEDEALRQTLVLKGRERVAAFSWNMMAKATLAIYNAILKGPK